MLGCGGADRASKEAILEHYQLALQDLIATGRVKWFPQCKYIGEGCFVSTLHPQLKYEVKVQRKVVDATLCAPRIPLNEAPNYEVTHDANLVPVNNITNMKPSWERYVVIGAGKTGLDAIHYLLKTGIKPKIISWIISNDVWFISRDIFFADQGSDQPKYLSEAILGENVNNFKDALEVLEIKGCIMRLDHNVWPTKFRGATVSIAEMEQFARVKNKIRMGRVKKIEADRIIFHSGKEIPTSPDTLHIDCTAPGAGAPPLKKIFEDNTINLLSVQFPGRCLNSCIIATLEMRYPWDEEKKNAVCDPIPAPEMQQDLFDGFLRTLLNADRIVAELGFWWMRSRRVTPVHHMTLPNLLRFVYNASRYKTQMVNKLTGWAEEGYTLKN